MSRPVRRRQRRGPGLAKELQKSVQAGPRVWLLAVGAVAALLLLPLVSRWLYLLAAGAVSLTLVLAAPVLLGAWLAAFVKHCQKVLAARAAQAMAAAVTAVADPVAAAAPKQVTGRVVEPSTEDTFIAGQVVIPDEPAPAGVRK